MHSALTGHQLLSIDLHVDALADSEQGLNDSLNKNADDALMCLLADDGDAAMMAIDWVGSIYLNESTLKKLRSVWRKRFNINVQNSLPTFIDSIHRTNFKSMA